MLKKLCFKWYLVDVRAQNKIHLKIQELLSFFHRRETNCQIHLMSFLNKKASLSDKRALRESLIYQIRSHKNYKEVSYDWKKLLKLKTKPSLPLAGISISYCHYLGVFVIVFDKKVSIGFDIEYKSRVTSKLLNGSLLIKRSIKALTPLFYG